MAEPEKIILKKTIPVESFGGEERFFSLPPGEYEPTVWTVGNGNADWWLVGIEGYNFMLGLPAEEWKFLAGKGILTISKKF